MTKIFSLVWKVYLDLQKALVIYSKSWNPFIKIKTLLNYCKRTLYNSSKSFLCERMQNTLIKESESSLKTVSHGVPQGSVLKSLLLILFINNMHNSVEYCKVHHYVDEANLLLRGNSLKKINRQVNHDLSLICHCLWPNKI